MSSSKTKKLQQQIPFTATYNSGTSTLTITGASALTIAVGDLITLASPFSPQILRNVAVASGTSTTSFTVVVPAQDYGNLLSGTITLDFFRQTTTQFVTLPRTGPQGSLVVTSTNSGTGSVSLSPSGNGVQAAATVLATVTNTSNSTMYAAITDMTPAYVQSTITVGAGKLEVWINS
jgi:hypothetical protein